MAHPRIGLLALGAAFILMVRGDEPAARAQERPRDAEKEKGGVDVPLPEGAKLRLGSGIPFRVTQGFALRPPDYTTLLVPDLQGELHIFDVATGRARGKSSPTSSGLQIILSGDGKRYINARTGKLAVREVESGKTIAEIDPPQGFSTVFATNAASAALSQDGSRVAQGGQSMNGMGHVFVHDVDTKEIIFQAPMQYAGPAIPLLSADGKYLATRRYRTVPRADVKEDPKLNFSAQVWDVDAGKELFTAAVTGGGLMVNGMVFSPDGKTLAISCGGGPIDLWDVPEGKHRAAILGRMRQGVHLAFSADGKMLAGISADGVIQRWNAADGKSIDSTEWTADVPLSYPRGLAFAADGRDGRDGRVVAWGSSGPVPVVWEAPSGKSLSRMPEHTGAIRSIAFAVGGKEIITASQDGRIIRWDAATGRSLGRIALKLSGQRYGFSPTQPIAGLSADGSRAMTGGSPSAIYELPSGKELFGMPLAGGVPATRFVEPAHGLTTAISLSTPVDRKSPGAAMVWDLRAARKVGEVEIEPGLGASPAALVTPGGSRLVVAAVMPIERGQQKMVIIAWDLKTGKKLCRVEVPPGNVQMELAAADENTVLLLDGLGKLRRLEIGRGAFGEDLEPTSTTPLATSPIVFNADRTRFAVGVAPAAGQFGVRLHEWPSGKVLHTFKGSMQVTALTFSPDGKKLASGSFDGTVLMWDLSTLGK